jgi:hypothetical protein
MADEKLNKTVDCLLQEHASIKAEISRRAGRQQIAFGTFFVVVGFSFKAASEETLSSVLLVGVWWSSVLALLFYLREDAEIARLGSLIRCEISSNVRKLLSIDRCRGPFYSEASLKSRKLMFDASLRKRAHTYEALFDWIVFFFAPLGLTLTRLLDVITPIRMHDFAPRFSIDILLYPPLWTCFFVGVAALWVACMLCKCVGYPKWPWV